MAGKMFAHTTVYLRADYRDLLYTVAARLGMSASEFIRSAAYSVATPEELEKCLGISRD